MIDLVNKNYIKMCGWKKFKFISFKSIFSIIINNLKPVQISYILFNNKNKMSTPKQEGLLGKDLGHGHLRDTSF